MGRPSTGVLTTPGVLGSHLADLDLSRKELADLLRVSVRTVHNIEHGRKRVDRRVLDRLGQTLNACWGEKYPAAEPLACTGDRFSADPMAVINVFLQSLGMNRPELVYGDFGVGHPWCRWDSSGRPEEVPFAGEYYGPEVVGLFDRFHHAFHLAGPPDHRIFLDQKNMAAAVRFTATVRHLTSGNCWEFFAIAEVQLKQEKIQQVNSVFDAERIAEFLRSGAPPASRRSF